MNRKLLLTAAMIPMCLAADPVSDSFGYRVNNSATYVYQDISSTGTSVLAGTDDSQAVINLPFAFGFYGVNYTSICVSDNGLIAFGSCVGADFTNLDLTVQSPPGNQPLIAPFWMDLTFTPPGSGSVFYQTVGVSPSRRFIVQWNDAAALNVAGTLNFQVILSERSNTIQFQYKNVDSTSGAVNKGAGATVGIRGANGNTNGNQLQWSYRAAVLGSASTLEFDPPALDLTLSVSHPGGSGGHFSQGQNGATYSIVVSNISASPTSGPITVAETIPSGLSLVSMQGNAWTCGSPNPANVCSRSDVLGGNSSYQPITVTVNVTANAPASVTNSATVNGSGDVNSANNTANDPTTINAIQDVTSSSSVTQGGFIRNRSTGLWVANMTVTNTGSTTIQGPVQVVITNLTAGVTMANPTGTRNGNPYLTVTAGAIAPGGSATVALQMNNPQNSFINFTPVVNSGVY